ncbi:hypothetical protein ACIQOV_36145, partial [Kitasatospora sp. NPDC091257]
PPRRPTASSRNASPSSPSPPEAPWHRDPPRSPSRRSDTADQWPRTYEQWQQLHRVRRATWLCRRCRVVFLPAASFRPDSAGSSALPVAHCPQWSVAVARQDDRPGAPTTSA